jgi:hypothetical protein
MREIEKLLEDLKRIMKEAGYTEAKYMHIDHISMENTGEYTFTVRIPFTVDADGKRID